MPPLTVRLLRALAGWVLVLGLTAVAVHPEGCGRPTDEALDHAAAQAVAWFGANLKPDGDFVYRYDRERGAEEPGYNDTRHAGVLWSLWQAERVGISGAGSIAEAAFTRVEDRLIDTSFGPAYGRGSVVESGTMGLLVAALDERRLVTGNTDHDELLIGLGHTLAAAVNVDGSVSADLHVDNGPSDRRSPFFTGEVMWALARLHLTFPAEGYDVPAVAIRRYLVEDRDAMETPWPPVSDHWGAYAFETMDRWPNPPILTAPERQWQDRQLGLFGLQVRYESQRKGGITLLTRGNIALPAGVGTLGEGLGNYLLQLLRSGDRPGDHDVLTERADCVAHLLVGRQITASDAAEESTPHRSIGAWFRLGETQMDDQQHALSALLLLREVRATPSAFGKNS